MSGPAGTGAAHRRPRLVVTPGDPAGIGAEITLKACAGGMAGLPRLLLIDDPVRLRACARLMGLTVPIVEADPEPPIPAGRDGALTVLPIRFPAPVVPGRPDPANAGAVIESIRMAVRLVQAGAADAIVTNPISKQVLKAAGFPHPGHTEFLGRLGGGDGAPVMMLVSDDLRVVPATVHEPLRAVPDLLSGALIRHCAGVTAQALRRDFGIAAPRLTVTGLNPHAGEGGTIGREEVEIIAPAIASLRRDGLDVRGPAPADTLFHPEARRRYDAAICMYHDQALIPLKTVGFWSGVNVTLGLPFVRTSPDHGTGFDIAGTGRAKAASLLAAIRLAAAMATARMRGAASG